jgi:enoyl-[acyl-carrier-protein] reductase (NADH)
MPQYIFIYMIAGGRLTWEAAVRPVGQAGQVFEPRGKEWVPMGREQTPEGMGHLAVFLASEGARSITGQAIDVGGGIVRHRRRGEDGSHDEKRRLALGLA